MAMYAIGTQPLICRLDGIAKQVWYADDSAAGRYPLFHGSELETKLCTSESFHYVHQGSKVVPTPSSHRVSN